MRAWRYRAHGAPSEVLNLEELESPEPGPGQLLVEVHAAAINFADGLVVRGTYQASPPLPAVAGMELTGRVVAVGPGVRREIGTRICGLTPYQSGAFADLAVVDVDDAFEPPGTFSAAQAAGFASAYQTAWFAVHVRGRVAEGDSVIVHAAAGGVGTAAVQLAAAAGAHVVGVVGNSDKAEVARAAGCSEVVLRSSEDAVAQLKEATRGGAHVVIDPVGGDAHAISERVTRFDGRIVVLGFASGVVPQVRADLVMVKNISVVGLHWGLYRSRAPEVVAEQYASLRSLIESRRISPFVSSVVPMEQLPYGLDSVESGSSHGRVVLAVRPGAAHSRE